MNNKGKAILVICPNTVGLGSMFVHFVGFPDPQMYVPMNFIEVMHCVILWCNKLVNHKITFKRTNTILIIQEHWFPQIKIIPQYL